MSWLQSRHEKLFKYTAKWNQLPNDVSCLTRNGNNLALPKCDNSENERQKRVSFYRWTHQPESSNEEVARRQKAHFNRQKLEDGLRRIGLL